MGKKAIMINLAFDSFAERAKSAETKVTFHPFNTKELVPMRVITP